MPTPSLLTSTGHIDQAACRAIALTKCAWAKGHPRYDDVLAGTLEVLHTQARQEQRRRGMGPDELALAELTGRLDACFSTDPHQDRGLEQERRRLRGQIAEVRERIAASAPVLIAAE